MSDPNQNYSYRFNREFILPVQRYVFETNLPVLPLNALKPFIRRELSALDAYWINYQHTYQKPFSAHFREVCISVNIDGRQMGQLFYATSVLERGDVEWIADLSRSRFQSIHIEHLDIFSYDDVQLSTLLVQEFNAQLYGKARLDPSRGAPI